MEYITENRVNLHYDMPLNEVIYDFFDALKSKTRGYGSLDYEFTRYEPSKVVKLDILLNKEIIAINQDALGKAAERIVNLPAQQVYIKPLADGSHALAILNPSDTIQHIHLNFATIGLNGKYTVRDVWQHRDIARKAKSWKGSVAAHETKVFVVK